MDETDETPEFNRRGTLLIAELLSMPWKYRIEAVWKDVDSRADRFRSIDPMKMARALHVPFESLRNTDWSDDWGCFQTVEELSIASLIQEGYSMAELIARLDGKIDSERLAFLASSAREVDDHKSAIFEFLTADERGIIVADLTEERLDDVDGGHMVCCYNVETSSDDVLQFHVTDNGYEVYVVATPYDVRDESTFFNNSVSRQV